MIQAGADRADLLNVTTSQLTMTDASGPRAWSPPTLENRVVEFEAATTIPDCDWEWKFSELVDSICTDYDTPLPSFTSFSWD